MNIQMSSNINDLLARKEQLISKFPTSIQNLLKKVENPLDESQVLVEIFKDKDVRIVLRKELDDFGDEVYVAYYSASDVAKLINYNNTHVENWTNRWGVCFVSYETITSAKCSEHKRSQNGTPEKSPDVYIINERQTRKDGNFLSEQELKKVLIKVKTPEAKLFQDWILRQSSLTQKLFDSWKCLQFQVELQKKDELLSKQAEHIKDLSLESVKLYPERTTQKGEIYLITSPYKQGNCAYKIFCAKYTEDRADTLKTSDPDLHIVHKRATEDIVIAEGLIHGLLKDRQYNGEFCPISSKEIGIELIDYICGEVDTVINKFGDDWQKLRERHVELGLLDSCGSLDLLMDDANKQSGLPCNKEEIWSDEKEKVKISLRYKTVEKGYHKACLDCKTGIVNSSERCRACAAKYIGLKNRKVVDRPTSENLIASIEERGISAVSREFGVKVSSLQKWLPKDESDSSVQACPVKYNYLDFNYPNFFTKNKEIPEKVPKRVAKNPTKSCPDCGMGITDEGQHCTSCAAKRRAMPYRKVANRPSNEELTAMVKEKGFSAVGREFGVSDNAVRKWLGLRK